LCFAICAKRDYWIDAWRVAPDQAQRSDRERADNPANVDRMRDPKEALNNRVREGGQSSTRLMRRSHACDDKAKIELLPAPSAMRIPISSPWRTE